MQGLIGKKVGMTRIFDDKGTQVPVTVIEVGPCVVLQRKTLDRDGYEAAQLGFEDQKEQRLTRPLQGHFKKAGAAPKRCIREFPLEPGEEVRAGDTITAALFADAAYVDIIGTTKGRGFQGVVKRHNMAGGRATHGSSIQRRVGSIGQCATPSRVHKGRRMPGHMGAKRRTAQNLKVVKVREEDNVILVLGAVPGPNGGLLYVSKALKKRGNS